jgi:PleD family two-component response regulator
MTDQAKTILVVINDLFFYTKLRDALLPQGYKLERARTQDDFASKAAAGPDAVVMNLNDLNLDPFRALTLLKADPLLAKVPVLAFANHEEVDTWHRAKTLGVSKIVSRNEFSARTGALVEEIFGARS